MTSKAKGLGLFSKLSRRSLSDLTEWNRFDDKLMKLIEEGDLKDIASYLKKKKTISTKLDPQGHSVLHVASMRNKFDVVQLLIAYGANVLAVDFQGRTALHCAARHGACEVLKVLCHCKEDDWPRDDNSMTALHHACIGGNIDCVLNLIRTYPLDMHSKDEDGRTPLFYSAQIGHLPVCKELLDRGAFVNAQDKYSRTPLMCAAENGNTAICELLVNKGADADMTDSLGHTAAWLAIDAGHTSIKHVIEGEDNSVKLELEKISEYSYKERDHLTIPEESESVFGDDNGRANSPRDVIATLDDVIAAGSLDDISDSESDLSIGSDYSNDDDKEEEKLSSQGSCSEAEEGEEDSHTLHLSQLSYTMSGGKKSNNGSPTRSAINNEEELPLVTEINLDEELIVSSNTTNVTTKLNRNSTDTESKAHTIVLEDLDTGPSSFKLNELDSNSSLDDYTEPPPKPARVTLPPTAAADNLSSTTGAADTLTSTAETTDVITKDHNPTSISSTLPAQPDYTPSSILAKDDLLDLDRTADRGDLQQLDDDMSVSSDSSSSSDSSWSDSETESDGGSTSTEAKNNGVRKRTLPVIQADIDHTESVGKCERFENLPQPDSNKSVKAISEAIPDNSEVVDLKRKLEEQLQKNVELERQVTKLQAAKSHESDDWSDSELDNEEETTPIDIDTRRGDEGRPVAKVSGQPRRQISVNEENREIAKLRQEVQSLEQENAILQEQISSLKEKNEETEKVRRKLYSELDIAKTSLEVKIHENSKLSTEADELKMNVFKYRERSVAAQEQNRTYKKEVEKMTRKLELYDKEYRKVRERLKRKEANEKKMLKDRQTMMRKLDEASKQVKAAESALKQRNATESEETEQLLTRCEELEQEVAYLTDQVQDQSYETERLNEMYSCNEEILELKQLEVQSLEKQIAILRDVSINAPPQRRDSFSNTQKTIRSLQEQVGKLQSQLAETASSYQETIDIYRNHLLLASHTGLDQELVEALQHITELRKST